MRARARAPGLPEVVWVQEPVRPEAAWAQALRLLSRTGHKTYSLQGQSFRSSYRSQGQPAQQEAVLAPERQALGREPGPEARSTQEVMSAVHSPEPDRATDSRNPSKS